MYSIYQNFLFYYIIRQLTVKNNSDKIVISKIHFKGSLEYGKEKH